MKAVKKILIITLALILTLATTLNVFAVDLSEATTEPEVIISESTEQPQEQLILEETTVPDITETANPDISEKIYGLTLNPDKIFMLPNDTFQLEVGLLTSPPENPLRTEFIEEEATEVLVTEPQTDEELTEVLEGTTETEEETTVIAEETKTYPAEIPETTVAESEPETEHTTIAETEEHTEISETVTDTQSEAYTENISGIISDSDLSFEPITEDENETLDLIWSSSDEAVAAVGHNGLIYSRELGTAIVTASTPDGVFSAFCEVNVVEEIPEENENSVIPLGAAYQVAISPNTTWSDKPRHWPVKLATEFSVNFDVYKCDSSGNYIGNEADISSLVNWQSSDTSVATVDIYGRVTGHKNGSTTITVSAKNGDTISVYNTVHVTVYTPYSSTHSGMAKLWATQYKSTIADCHSDRQAGVVSPGTLLNLYGTSGGYILGSIQGETGKYFMWASNLYDKTNGEIEICKSGTTSDTRRHWDMYTTQTVSLALTDGASATWTTSDANIAKVSGNTSYTGRTVTINPVAEGTAYITANSGGKIDVIHVTVITRFTENGKTINKMGITQVWCNNFKCSHTKCTILDRKVGTTNENMLVTLYGESGGFYYANPVGTNLYIYLWKSNINMQSWYPQCELENTKPLLGDYKPQGFAVDTNYCYSFEVKGTANSEQFHRLFRYNINSNELTEMEIKENEGVGDLWHANDATIVEFTENGVSVPYIFVAAYSDKKINSIVKLRFNSLGEYWETARYNFPEGFEFVSIACISNAGNESASFLIKSGNNFHTVTIPNNLSSGTTLTPSLKFSIKTVDGFSSQGTHYDISSDTLYIAFSSKTNFNENCIKSYTGILNASGTISSSSTWTIKKGENTDLRFEVEGIGFRPNSNDDKLWFLTLEMDEEEKMLNGGIYTDYQEIKQ